MKQKRVDEKRSHALIVTLLSNLPTAWLIKKRLLSMLGNVSLGQVQNTKKENYNNNNNKKQTAVMTK